MQRRRFSKQPDSNDTAQMRLSQWLQFTFVTNYGGEYGEWTASDQGANLILLCTCAFRNSKQLLSSFSDVQLSSGLAMINGHGSYLAYLAHPCVEQSFRLQCIDSMEALFADLFATGRLEPEGFMWFENLLSTQLDNCPRLAESVAIVDRIVALLDRLLTSQSILLARSALHGLNHFHQYRRGAVEMAINSFLDSSPLKSELENYARLCLSGDAL